MTRCEQKKNEMIPAAGGELAAQGGVVKLEGFCNASPPILPHARVVKPEGFYNSQGGVEGEVQGGVGLQSAQENDLLASLPQPVLASKGGRPKAVTPQIQEQLCLLLSVGLSRRQAAAYLGIDHTTVSRTATKDAEFSADLKRAEDVAAGRPLLSIFDASRKSWRAAVWLVEHRRLHPPALTPEEKAAKHQESLEEVRRVSELSHEHMRVHELQCEEDRERRKARKLARSDAEYAVDVSPGKRKARSVSEKAGEKE